GGRPSVRHAGRIAMVCDEALLCYSESGMIFRPMVVNHQPSQRIAYGLHTTFMVIYLLLLMRPPVSLYEGPIDIAHLPRNSVPTVMLKRVCGTLLAPFWAVGFPFPWDYRDFLTPALVIALLTYGLIHYGMFMSVSVEGGDSMASKILNFC